MQRFFAIYNKFSMAKERSNKLELKLRKAGALIKILSDYKNRVFSESIKKDKI